MKQKSDANNNGTLSGVEPALRRARELAAKTGTPLVISIDGKIKKLRIRPKPATRST